MKAILLAFDSLNRHYLSSYGNDWVSTPNFTRLSEKALTFDNCFVGSMPCMPARRELHTGRYNFLHRSWGPVEPFDDSMPEMLKNDGVYTHLVSDHFHYWEDGGCNYHTRYSSWDVVRGQEGDPWIGQVEDPEMPDFIGKYKRHDEVFRQYCGTQEKMPQHQTITKGLEFIEKNRDSDNWFLQIETFDPHEPFFTLEHYQKLYPDDYPGPRFDWPEYGELKYSREQVEHLRRQYAALVTMCDDYLGKVLDMMDTYSLWDDTMLIVWADHGFLLESTIRWRRMCNPCTTRSAKFPFLSGIHERKKRKNGERSWYRR